MKIAPTPEHEQERLADLQALNVLDTEPEARYDRLTRLAAGVFEVPIAYLALVDSERQWFKSRCGLSEESTNRSVSFCGHAIVEDRLMVVEDARLDERFHDNPMVTGPPHIRFYAGYPLRGKSGHNVGTFCIADTRPRTRDAINTELLTELAAVAERELNLVDLLASQHELLATKNALLDAQHQQAADLDLAAQYVSSQLPSSLNMEGLQIASEVRPSSSLGGDFVSYLADDDRAVCYLLDVSGHGIASGLLAVSLHHAIRQIQARDGLDSCPGRVLTELNALFQLSEQGGRFATIWYAHLDRQQNRLRYANAGHHPALLIRDRKPLELSEGGPPMGVVSGFEYQSSDFTLAAQDRLYQYSDGLFEELPARDDTEPRAALNHLFASMDMDDGSLVKQIIDRVQSLTNVPEFNDDVSVLELYLQ